RRSAGDLQRLHPRSRPRRTREAGRRRARAAHARSVERLARRAKADPRASGGGRARAASVPRRAAQPRGHRQPRSGGRRHGRRRGADGEPGRARLHARVHRGAAVPERGHEPRSLDLAAVDGAAAVRVHQHARFEGRVLPHAARQSRSLGVARRRARRRRFRASAAAGGAALNNEAVFALRGVEKVYDAGGTRFELTVPQLDVKRGGKLALIGESGSGKSTLLELLAMILTPTTSGTFGFAPVKGEPASDVGEIWKSRDSDRLGQLRSRHIGYVLQHGGLLPYLTVRRNIELSRRLLGLPVGDFADQLAAKLGIAAQLDKLPSALSVGQRQRAAIA